MFITTKKSKQNEKRAIIVEIRWGFDYLKAHLKLKEKNRQEKENYGKKAT